VDSFCRDVDTLRDDVARIEKRIERLSAAGKG
jgi:ubiquinone biosynthesis protein UbiJ